MTTPRRRPHQHALEIVRTGLTVGVVAAALLFGFGALPPVDPMEVERSRLVLGIVIDLLLVSALLATIVVWQARRVATTHRALPALIEALALVFVLYIGVFARLYHVLSTWAPGSFSSQLDYFSSVYFAMTVLSTIGFGDIVPQMTGARTLTMVQMVGNLVLLGVVVRVLTSAASSERPRKRREEPAEEQAPST